MNTQVSFKNWKIKVTLFMAIIVVLIAFVSSCEKEKDYRDKWVGTYDFKIRYKYSLPQSHYSIDTTYFYLGSVTKSAHDNKIIVDWGNDTIIISGISIQKSELTVDSDGQLTYPEFDVISTYHIYFHDPSYIHEDTIRFGFNVGSLGHSKCWEIIGLKTKKSNYKKQ